MGLNFLISILSGVFFLFLVVMYLEVPGMPDSLCSVHSKITWILLPFFAIIILVFQDYLINPFSFASFKTTEIPFLLLLFKDLADTFKVTHRSSSGIYKRFLERFSYNLLLF